MLFTAIKMCDILNWKKYMYCFINKNWTLTLIKMLMFFKWNIHPPSKFNFQHDGIHQTISYDLTQKNIYAYVLEFYTCSITFLDYFFLPKRSTTEIVCISEWHSGHLSRNSLRVRKEAIVEGPRLGNCIRVVVYPWRWKISKRSNT